MSRLLYRPSSGSTQDPLLDSPGDLLLPGSWTTVYSLVIETLVPLAFLLASIAVPPTFCHQVMFAHRMSAAQNLTNGSLRFRQAEWAPINAIAGTGICMLGPWQPERNVNMRAAATMLAISCMMEATEIPGPHPQYAHGAGGAP